MNKEIVIVLSGESLCVGATQGMDAAEVNYWLDVAKKQLIETGVIDVRLPVQEPARETQSPIVETMLAAESLQRSGV